MEPTGDSERYKGMAPERLRIAVGPVYRPLVEQQEFPDSLWKDAGQVGDVGKDEDAADLLGREAAPLPALEPLAHHGLFRVAQDAGALVFVAEEGQLLHPRRLSRRLSRRPTRRFRLQSLVVGQPAE